MKQIKIFAFFLFVQFFIPGFAFSTPLFDAPGNVLPPCPYPTPTNFHATAIEPTSITLAWAQPGAQPPSYNMKTYLISNNTLVSDVTFPNVFGPIHKVSGLQPGNSYRFELRPTDAFGSMCENNVAITISTTLILELTLVNWGMDNPSLSYSCFTVYNESKCAFSTASPAIFKIWNKNDKSIYKEFHVIKVNTNRYQVDIQTDQNEDFRFKCLNQLGIEEVPPPLKEGKEIVVRDPNNGSTRYASFILLEENGINFLELTSNLPSDYEIVLIESGQQHSEAAFNTENIDQNDHISAAPNPFNEALEINIPFTTEGADVHITLTNLLGRLVTTMHTPGGTPKHTLSTEQLQPGIYLLRVESGGRSETIKVLKTQ